MEELLTSYLESVWEENLSSEDEKLILNKISKLVFEESLRTDQIGK
jgi:hypothetical protein